MPDRHLIYFASDVHLGLDVSDKEGREARFVKFLRSIPAGETSALYLLGDIWDFWYEYDDVVPRGYVRVLSSLMDLVAAGVDVYFFRGNHDMWTFGYLESLGIKVLEQPYVTVHDGRTFCLGHGDGLGPGMMRYKCMRSVFRSKFLQGCFSALHPHIAYSLGNGWSRRNRLSHKDEYKFRGADEPIVKFAESFSAHTPVDFFIFGHLHCRVDMTLQSGSRLLILKDWFKSDSYLLYDGRTGILGYSPNNDQ